MPSVVFLSCFEIKVIGENRAEQTLRTLFSCLFQIADFFIPKHRPMDRNSPIGEADELCSLRPSSATTILLGHIGLQGIQRTIVTNTIVYTQILDSLLSLTKET
jgi:hypothetical protein